MDSKNNWTAEIEAAWQLREDNPQKALKTVNRLGHLALPESPDHAKLLIVEAACHWRHFNFADMMDRLVDAFEILKTQKDNLWMARLQGRISVGLTSVGDMSGAYKHLHLQLSAAAGCQNGDEKNTELFTVFHNMGRHFFVREDFLRANQCYKRCYQYLSSEGTPTVLLQQNHAETLARLGKLTQAANKLEQALALAEGLPPNRSVVYALGVKSWILIEQKKPKAAEQTLFNAIDYAVKNNIPSAQTRMKLATVHLAEQLVDLALDDMQPVADLIKFQGDKHDSAQYHEVMSQVYEASGNYQASLSHFKKYHQTQQVIRTSQNNSRMQAENLIDKLEGIRRESTILKRDNIALKDTVSRYKSLHEEARELSEKDPLTGLYNRRMLESIAENIIRLTSSTSSSVAVAVVDLDHFKRTNDTFGHHVGDLVLIEFAKLISATFRSADCIARYGGEEFVLVMPQANERNAREALYRLRELVAKFQWQQFAEGLSVTFSAGITTTTNQESFQTLFQNADKALYLAKALGRDKICIDGDPINFDKTILIPDIDLAETDEKPAVQGSQSTPIAVTIADTLSNT